MTGNCGTGDWRLRPGGFRLQSAITPSMSPLRRRFRVPRRRVAETGRVCVRERSAATHADAEDVGSARRSERRTIRPGADRATRRADPLAEDRGSRRIPPAHCRPARTPVPSVAREACRYATRPLDARHGPPPRSRLAPPGPRRAPRAAAAYRHRGQQPRRDERGTIASRQSQVFKFGTVSSTWCPASAFA